VDETQNISPDLFDTILRPCLSDRQGFAIFIGTPMGRNWFFELHEKAKHTKDWFTCVFKASETKILDDEDWKQSVQNRLEGRAIAKIVSNIRKSNITGDFKDDETLL